MIDIERSQHLAHVFYTFTADVADYLRIAHEQNLIATIEEGRRETQEEFYHVLKECSQLDWEARKNASLKNW
jgi:hypothetical protein